MTQRQKLSMISRPFRRRVTALSSCLAVFHTQILSIAPILTSGTNGTCRLIVQPPILKKHTAQSFDQIYLQVADLDGDHRLDVVYGLSQTRMIELFLGFTNNSFKAHHQYVYKEDVEELFNNPVAALLIADVNHDHHLDLILRYAWGDNMSVGYGYGNGSFRYPTALSTIDFSSPATVLIGDVNNDTHFDFLIALGYNVQILVHLGRQDGSFSDVPDHRMKMSKFAWSLALADFNTDGIIDLAYGDDDGQVGIFIGMGDGSFQSERVHSTETKGINNRIKTHDLNGDGTIDIVFTDGLTFGVMLNDGRGTFRNSFFLSFIFDHSIESIEIADVNNDHHLDIAIVHYSPRGTIKIYCGFGNGSFTESEVINASATHVLRELQLADFNGDHHIDILVATNDALIFILNDCSP